MRREFTGKHMAAIIVSGFAIIIAVNLFMATLAVRGFGGVIVENSYVASQEFNDRLEAGRQQKALGWSAEMTRAEAGHLRIETAAIPQQATLSAIAYRPLGQLQTTHLLFNETKPGHFASRQPLDTGRWIVRLTVSAPDGRIWSTEEKLP